LNIYSSIRGYDEEFIGLNIGAGCNCVPVLGYHTVMWVEQFLLVLFVKMLRKFTNSKPVR